MSIIAKYAGLSLKKNFAYKANGVLVIVDTLMDVFAVWLFWTSLLELDLNLTEWSGQSLRVFMGYSLISSSVSNLFVGAWDIQGHVEDGTLDSYIVKPCSAVLLILLERANFLRFLVTFPIGFLLIAINAGVHKIAQTLAGILLCIAATILVELLIIAVYELCFWAKRVDSYADIMETVFSISKYPLIFFNRKIVMLFTYIVPVAFMSTIPTELVTGGKMQWSFCAFLVLAVLIVGLTVLLWKAGRRRYESAN